MDFFLYSWGVCPKCFLNDSENLLGFKYPDKSEISPIDIKGLWINNLAAASKQFSLIKLPIELPVMYIKHLFKLDSEIAYFFDKLEIEYLSKGLFRIVLYDSTVALYTGSEKDVNLNVSELSSKFKNNNNSIVFVI